MSQGKLMYLDDEARERMIRYIKRRMDKYGITVEHLKEGQAQEKTTDGQEPRAPVYRDALGNTWDEVGEPPLWLQRALSMGLDLDHFRITR
jgi:DNA-binding protein H-NS